MDYEPINGRVTSTPAENSYTPMFEVGGADGNNFSPTLSEAERGVIAPTRQSV